MAGRPTRPPVRKPLPMSRHKGRLAPSSHHTGGPVSQDATNRSLRLFQLLLEIEKTRITPVFSLDAYERVLWLAQAPAQPEVRSALRGETADSGTAVLVVQRPQEPEPVTVPAELVPLVTDGDEPSGQPPQFAGEVDDERRRQHAPALEQHQRAWQRWADERARVAPIKTLYRDLFQMHETLAASPEDFELVVGVGLLQWAVEPARPTKRHTLSCAGTVLFDPDSGEIAIELDEGREATIELDMLDSEHRPRKQAVDQLAEQLLDINGSPLDHDAVDRVLRSLAHDLGHDGSYEPDQLRPTTAQSRPTVGFAPAIVLRKPSNDRKLQALQAIVAQIEAGTDVPAGVLSLVEPMSLDDNQLEMTDERITAFAAYLPLPANQRQREIVWSAEHRQHTVVIGPPGTGKTHTIANVLSHLLATGKRVLVTAEKVRALEEVQGKLPDELQELTIAVLGQSRGAKDGLGRSVTALDARADRHNPTRANEEIAGHQHRLDQARRDHARLLGELVEDERGASADTHTIGGYAGSLSKLTEQVVEDLEVHGWLVDEDAPVAAPLDPQQGAELLTLLRSDPLNERHETLGHLLPAPDLLPEPAVFLRLVADEAAAAQVIEDTESLRLHRSHPAGAALSEPHRTELIDALDQTASQLTMLAARPEPWVPALLADAAVDRLAAWERRAEQLDRDLPRADRLAGVVGRLPVSLPAAPSRDELLAQARGLLDHLEAGGKIRKLLAPAAVKGASDLLDTVKVNGGAPDTPASLKGLLGWGELQQLLDDAEKLWPADTPIPEEDTATERLGWLHDEARILTTALLTAKALTDVAHRLEQLDVPPPTLGDPASMRLLADVLREPSLQAELDKAQAPLRDAADRVPAGAAPIRAELRHAIVTRDGERYAAAHSQLLVLQDLQRQAHRRDQLFDLLRQTLPATAADLMDTAASDHWGQRLAGMQQACDLCRAHRYVHQRVDGDRLEELLGQLTDARDRISRILGQLTVAKAWAHAIERLNPEQRQRLKRYAHLTNKITQGGQHRAREVRNARQALRLCRDAVPAWIMPLAQVTEALDMQADAFDVVIVDEASQATMDAVFLQWLAPKVIVIGDDRQVSPTRIMRKEPLQRLVEQYLPDFEDKHTWEDAETSLFDHARMRYGKSITLDEHFRCVPEIIRFSQRHIYEPDKIDLIPLRQYGADRLTPIRTVHVRDGYRVGKINPPEVDAIVDAVHKCHLDPAYERVVEGRPKLASFGVISLRGDQQARQIESGLLETLGEVDYHARQLRCGVAADFQGSERDVMFLSLVEAVNDEGHSPRKDAAIKRRQRLNVAASRARDQQWLVHSVTPEQLHPEDLGRSLLEHCLTVEAQFGQRDDVAVPAPVPHDRLLEDRFDSLFEQRVFNRIVERGYVVQSQVPAYGRRSIDLVVVGAAGRLAVECDGDHWHGPEQYGADLARQQDLERVGWKFLRIRESAFIADPVRALQPLWEHLNNLGILPAGHRLAAPQVANTIPTATAQAVDRTVENDGAPIQTTRPPQSRPAPAVATPGDGGAPPSTGSAATAGPSAPRPGLTLAEHRAWDTTVALPDPKHASADQARDALQAILRIEGPVLGARLYRLWLSSAGVAKGGTQYWAALDKLLRAAERSANVYSDNPYNDTDLKLKTWRLPDQDPVNPRTLGERSLKDVPPTELAHVLQQLRVDDQEAWLLAARDAYGLARLRGPSRQLLQRAASLLGPDR